MTKSKPNSGIPKGDPRGQAPLSYSRRVTSTAPEMRPRKNGQRVVHKEFVQDVVGSVAFSASKVPFQPGLPASFPWLSGIAKQYEMYRVHSAHALYIPAIGAQKDGQVFLSPDYDARDPNPTTEQQATSYAGTEQDRSWEEILMKFDVTAMHALGPRKYVRDTFVSLTDIKTYDAANLFVCSVGEADATVVGKLWFVYDIEFFNPQLPGSESAPGSNTTTFKNTSAVSFTSGIGQTLEWPTVLVDGLGLGVPPGGLVTLPKGMWNVDLSYTVKDTSAEALSLFLAITASGQSSYSSQCTQMVSVPANGLLQGNVFTTIPSDGTNLLSTSVTITGAAGTLTSVASENRLRITPA